MIINARDQVRYRQCELRCEASRHRLVAGLPRVGWRRRLARRFVRRAVWLPEPVTGWVVRLTDDELARFRAELAALIAAHGDDRAGRPVMVRLHGVASSRGRFGREFRDMG